MGRRRVAEKMRKAAGETVEKEGRPRPHPPPAPAGAAPWLVFSNGKGRKKQSFYSLTEKRCYLRSIPEMRGKTCWTSSHGWLVMLDDVLRGDCILWNPDSLETIRLPQLNSEDGYEVHECILSSPPTHPNCLVLFLSSRPPFFLFCRPGDKHWTKQQYQLVKDGVVLDDDFIDRIIGFSSGIMYAYTFEEDFAIIDTTPNGCLSVRLLDVERLPRLLNVSASQCFLVESCRELFLVQIMFLTFSIDSVTTATIYKMDFSGMVWVKVDSLGDRLFFLGRYSLSCSASDSGMKGNCLYFTMHKDKSLYMFDVQDESVSVFLPCPGLQTPWFSPYWVMPTANRLPDSPEQIITEDKGAVAEQYKQEHINEDEECLLFNLPEELHKLFAEHFPLPADYINFRATCRKWYSTTPPIMWSTDLTRSRIQSPWLMFFRKENGMCNFFDPMCNLSYCFDIPELSGARICFSKDGWLLMSRGWYSMFFFNPFTKKKINLPDHLENFVFDGYSFSSLPTSSDCIVFGILPDEFGWVRLGWLRLGDEAWTYNVYGDIGLFVASHCNPIFHNGAFYCLGQDGDLGVLDLKHGYSWTTLSSPQPPCSSTRQNYMVELNGEILSVFVGHLGKWTRVFRLDQSKMAWVHVKSLREKMIFVSRSTSLLVPATQRMQDKIFFPRFFSNNNSVFYSLGTAEYQSSFGDHSSKDFYGTKEQLHCTWIQPSLAWTIS